VRDDTGAVGGRTLLINHGNAESQLVACAAAH
jgi:hypothetical protein